jgi:hypothetical protein
MGERRGAKMILVAKPDGKNHLKDIGVDGDIILNGSLSSGMGRGLA